MRTTDELRPTRFAPFGLYATLADHEILHPAVLGCRETAAGVDLLAVMREALAISAAV
jgi:hypothetical protein